jgi:hypothetical protein
MDRSRKILTEHRDQLDRLAHALIEHEMLDREEIMKVIHGDTLQTAKKTRSLYSRTSPSGAGVNGASNQGTQKEPVVSTKKTEISRSGSAPADSDPPSNAVT